MPVTDADAIGLDFGVAPPAVVALARVFADKIRTAGEEVAAVEVPTQPSDLQGILEQGVEYAQLAVSAGGDLRALLTAYAHKFHNPKPIMAGLARAQGATRQAVTRRYTEKTVRAIRALLSETPDLRVVAEGFPSVTLADLAGLDDRFSDAARRARGVKADVQFWAQRESGPAAVDD